jgi:UDP-N-acetylglucosamine 2-epimerase (non-hydrolysing)
MEGIHPRRIYLTGSPMKEVIQHNWEKINSSQSLNTLKLNKNEYFIVSMHREENVDNKENLRALLESLNKLYEEYSYPIIVSTHPRTRDRLKKFKDIKINSNIKFVKPFGFLDYVCLLINSFCAISDSGTISEESALLSFPAILIRNATERPEALDSGNIIITGLESEIILKAVNFLTTNYESKKADAIPSDYDISDVSKRVVKLIIGLSKLSHQWDSIKLNDLGINQ